MGFGLGIWCRDQRYKVRETHQWDHAAAVASIAASGLLHLFTSRGFLAFLLMYLQLETLLQRKCRRKLPRPVPKLGPAGIDERTAPLEIRLKL